MGSAAESGRMSTVETHASQREKFRRLVTAIEGWQVVHGRIMAANGVAIENDRAIIVIHALATLAREILGEEEASAQ